MVVSEVRRFLLLRFCDRLLTILQPLGATIRRKLTSRLRITGFHFPETFYFRDDFIDHFKLNVKLTHSIISNSETVVKYSLKFVVKLRLMDLHFSSIIETG